MSDTIRLRAPVEVQAADGDKPIRVSILAYTGGIMAVSGFGDVAIELSGLKLPSSVPILADHNATLDGITGAGKPSVAGGTLMVDGTLSLANEATGRLVQLARDGVPFQASVGVQPVQSARIAAGEKVRVNGRVQTAGSKGLTLVRGGELREVSILPLGADGQTQVSIAAKANAMDPQVQGSDPTQVERERIKAISAACGGKYELLQARAIDEGWTLERCKAELLDVVRKEVELAQIRASRANVPFAAGGHAPNGGAAPRDQLACAALLMAGQGSVAAKAFGERAVAGSRAPSGWPELCAMALRLEHQDIPSDRRELIKAAFSTSSMPSALGLGVQKIALEVFTEGSQNWRAVARIVHAADFKDGKAIRLSAASRFEKVGPDGELKHGNLAEDAFDFRVETFGKVFGITRQHIINDDLGILTDLPLILGAEAVRSVSDLFFDTLIGAGSFFSSGNGNLLEAGSALGVASLGNAIKTLRTRKDRDNRIIGFRPVTLLVPAALESTARQVLNSTELWRDMDGGDQLPTGNPFSGVSIALAVEPRLDASSATAWYLFAETRHGAMLIAFLRGQESPTVEQGETPFDTLGQQWRGVLDFGVSLGEYRAVVKATGAS